MTPASALARLVAAEEHLCLAYCPTVRKDWEPWTHATEHTEYQAALAAALAERERATWRAASEMAREHDDEGKWPEFSAGWSACAQSIAAALAARGEA